MPNGSQARSNPLAIAYVPVVHAGYRDFFRDTGASEAYVLGPELISDFDYLRKEIRALSPNESVTVLQKLLPKIQFSVLNQKRLDEIAASGEPVVLADEDVTRHLAEQYLANNPASFATIFLRWDKFNSLKENQIIADENLSEEEFDQQMISRAEEQSQKSADWWRRVGTVVVKDGKVILTAFNEAVPTPHQQWADGDPRNAFSQGINIEFGVTIHAEVRAITEAARQGITLDGAEMYTNIFPCPHCAKVIAYSGIKKVYYRSGYGVLDAQKVLAARDVKLIRVAGVSPTNPDRHQIRKYSS